MLMYNSYDAYPMYTNISADTVIIEPLKLKPLKFFLFFNIDIKEGIVDIKNNVLAIANHIFNIQLLLLFLLFL